MFLSRSASRLDIEGKLGKIENSVGSIKDRRGVKGYG
jgi:hypothetical protein